MDMAATEIKRYASQISKEDNGELISCIVLMKREIANHPDCKNGSEFDRICSTANSLIQKYEDNYSYILSWQLMCNLIISLELNVKDRTKVVKDLVFEGSHKDTLRIMIELMDMLKGEVRLEIINEYCAFCGNKGTCFCKEECEQ